MNTLPYKKIPEAPHNYEGGNIVSRILDGLGYRYYWATEGLRKEDLTCKTINEARNIQELLFHICDLTEGIVHVAKHQVIVPPFDFTGLAFSQLLEKTLLNIENAGNLFKSKTGEELINTNLMMEFNGNRSEFPFWNVLVGPITDTGYHIGQIVILRRIAGNPINPKVNPFLGFTQ